MRKIKIIEHISMDGVIEHADDYVYGAWTLPYRSAEGMGMVMAAQGTGFDLIVGRRTYDSWTSFWPTAPGPFAPKMNGAKKYVATHRLEDALTWGPAENLGNDAIEGIRKLKETDGVDLVVSGSTSLTTILLAEGLVDEVVLVVYPVLLGKGKRLFNDTGLPREFTFVNSQTTPTGVLLNTYKYVGALKS